MMNREEYIESVKPLLETDFEEFRKEVENNSKIVWDSNLIKKDAGANPFITHLPEHYFNAIKRIKDE